jgi:hypothetical protein
VVRNGDEYLELAQFHITKNDRGYLVVRLEIWVGDRA